MAVAELVKIPGDLLSPLQTVTLGANSATMTVSGLSCNSRNYRLVLALTGSADGSLSALFNGNAADRHNGGVWETLTGSSADFDTIPGSLGAFYGPLRGTVWLRAKSGAARHMISEWSTEFVPGSRLFKASGNAQWNTTTGEITNIGLTASAGTIQAGSTIAVYDDGAA